MKLPYDPATALRHLSQRNEKLYLHKNLYLTVYSNFIHTIGHTDVLQQVKKKLCYIHTWNIT